jgi:hypothetical protein
MKFTNRKSAREAAMGILVLQFKQLACIAVIVAAATPMAHAATKKLWFCQSICVAVDSNAQQIRLVDLVSSMAKSRIDAYTEMKLNCHEAADRLGMPEAISARRVSYTSKSSRSSSRAWSMDVSEYDRDADTWESASGGGSGVSTSRRWWGKRGQSQWGESWNYDSRSRESTRARETKSSGSESFHTEGALSLNIDFASMRDMEVCSQEEVDKNWVPYYQPLPGGDGPRG